MLNSRLPIVVALNGPPGSGKTHISRLLLAMIGDAYYISPMEFGYGMMQADGLAPAGMKYHDFKRRPDARQRLINASHNYRAQDHNIYERRIVASDAYLSSRVVIIDNVGHVSDEMQFYDKHSSESLLIRVDAPYQELEPMKSRARRLRTVWENDSRTPMEHHTMLTAYDSMQLSLLLKWLSLPLTREEAGPYYGIKQLWDRIRTTSESHSGSDGLSGVARFVG